MYRLLALFNRYRTFLFLVFLESIALTLMVVNNTFHQLAAFNTSNRFIGAYFETRSNFLYYFSLKETNDLLAKENAYLRTKLETGRYMPDSSLTSKDTLRLNQFFYLKSRVIGNSTDRVNNFITLNKGRVDGISQSMGVICDKGIVGIVKTTSENYTTVYSVLHSDVKVSVKHKKSQSFGSLVWEGKNPRKGLFLFMPRHIPVQVGDTLVTSGFGEVFPEGVLVGTVDDIELRGDESTYRLGVNLSTDFSNIKYVYVVGNRQKQQLDSLQRKNSSEK